MAMIESQRRLLSDQGRNRAFAAAIRRAVRPGTRVADLGTGSGFLAILCQRAGARSVWACDADPGMIRLARQTAKANRAERIRFVHGHSTALAPPGPVDLVVAEVLGHFAGEEHIVESLVDARRWLAPGGAMLPAQVDQILCPVIAGTVQAGIDAIGTPEGVELAEVRRVALANGYVRTIPASELLAGGLAGQRIDRMRFPGDEPSRRRGAAAWTCDAAATVHGFALWWDAVLWEDIVLSTSPLAPPTHWEQVYLPLPTPLSARPGDRIEAAIELDTRWDAGCAVRWRGRLLRQGRAVASFAQDNREGTL